MKKKKRSTQKAERRGTQHVQPSTSMKTPNQSRPINEMTNLLLKNLTLIRENLERDKQDLALNLKSLESIQSTLAKLFCGELVERSPNYVT